ncbi:MAG: VTT domain-containing protein [Gammaproteobacteria bacterium]|nr:VTT domain-containing protein [Gammaproteobacteria bacterium]
MKNNLGKWLLLVLIVAGVLVASYFRDQLDVAALQAQISDTGAAGGLLFMLIYALGTVLFFPGAVLTLVGGALFGPVLGTVYNLTGATLGATVAFLLARYIASDWVEQKSTGRVKQLKQGVENEGWRFVAFVRLVPLFPFNLLNYALGLTRIPLLQFVLASYVFMLPGAIAYTYLGYAGREAVAGGDGLIQKILLAVALLAVAMFLPRFIKQMKRQMISVDELQQRQQNAESLLVVDVRNADEFRGELGHIAGAINIPLEALPQRLAELGADKAQPIALICHTDRRSSKAAELLARHAFSHLRVVKGGMRAWRGRGYAVQ